MGPWGCGPPGQLCTHGCRGGTRHPWVVLGLVGLQTQECGEPGGLGCSAGVTLKPTELLASPLGIGSAQWLWLVALP